MVSQYLMSVGKGFRRPKTWPAGVEFVMPNRATFEMRPVRELIERWVVPGACVVDPFARNSLVGSLRNDLDPGTCAEFHLPAERFCELLMFRGVRADVGLFDPPYSPRQIAECYRGVGLKVGAGDTQNAALYARVRRGLGLLIKRGGYALSFGWSGTGFGGDWGFEVREYLVLRHGGAHNATICVVEEKVGGL